MDAPGLRTPEPRSNGQPRLAAAATVGGRRALWSSVPRWWPAGAMRPVRWWPAGAMPPPSPQAQEPLRPSASTSTSVSLPSCSLPSSLSPTSSCSSLTISSCPPPVCSPPPSESTFPSFQVYKLQPQVITSTPRVPSPCASFTQSQPSTPSTPPNKEHNTHNPMDLVYDVVNGTESWITLAEVIQRTSPYISDALAQRALYEWVSLNIFDFRVSEHVALP